MKQPKQAFDAQELVDTFEVSLPTIWRWAKDGVIPKGKKLGGKRLWYAPQIDAVLSQFSDMLGAGPKRTDIFISSTENQVLVYEIHLQSGTDISATAPEEGRCARMRRSNLCRIFRLSD